MAIVCGKAFETAPHHKSKLCGFWHFGDERPFPFFSGALVLLTLVDLKERGGP